MSTNLVFSVQKAMNILDLLIFDDISRNGLRLSEISRRTGIKSNTLHNLLRTLIERDYVSQLENGNYVTGIKIDRICIMSQLNDIEYNYLPNELLDSLKDDIKENVIFAVLSAGEWKQIKQFRYESVVQVNSGRFRETSIYDKATGRIMVAYCSEQELLEIIEENGFPGDRWNGIVTLEGFEEEIKKIREDGMVDIYTQNNELWAIGIPVLDNRGKLIGAIGCAAPAFRCDEARKKYIRDAFTRTIEILEGA
ncbi:MAG TPA: IclR family transcriptional regulator C-terminal domain-containing protein [Clostridia bacterium]|nr:IclR family transcriptional regulator C-terminal domain-containing protein [Clostridia bacterium]HPQ46143.1 IclR family transcriptional regulator C-terminal domain-containing protein [Clostridia bacterium]